MLIDLFAFKRFQYKRASSWKWKLLVKSWLKATFIPLLSFAFFFSPVIVIFLVKLQENNYGKGNLLGEAISTLAPL